MITYKKAITQTLEDIFMAAHDKNICNFKKMELAKRSGLSYSTIYNLRTRKTKDPKYSTILKLCDAVGMDPQLAREQLGLSLAKRVTRLRIYGKRA
jgi:DNA-binding Xre family transcriptional regulator